MYAVRNNNRTITIERVSILGPNDFDNYKLNKPGKDWDLCGFSDGSMLWVGHKNLFTSQEKASERAEQLKRTVA